jgi:ubiquinol-cytochrome c reductase cytochrome b subunit
MASGSVKKSPSKYTLSFPFLNIERWINDRWPLTTFVRFGLEEEIPGGASFAYIFGSATLILFLLQVVTGICQLFYYVPTIDHAYDSLNYLRTEVPFGWLIHSLHYWGASAMILLIGLHMVRVFIWGAYKHPRELTWLVGVGLLLVTLSISFTGPTLAWDERGYWVAEVGTSIAGTVPVIGDWVKQLLRGGATMGQLTLSRFFILHITILPGILMVLIGIHLIAFRRFGISGPWNETKRKRIGLFWPDQILDDTVIVTLLCFILIVLTVFASAPITGPADPLDTSYVPKPEWNFLFLYQALKFFPGRLEPIGTVGIALFIILLLVFLPFIDRRAERNPRKRPFAMAGSLIFVIIVLALAIAGYYSKGPKSVQTPSKPVASVAYMSESAREGAKLFQSLSCTGCHRVNGMGGTAGPDLSNELLKGRSRQWLTTQIQNPKVNDPQTIMPAFSSLTHQQINAFVDYLQSLQYGTAPLPAVTPSFASGKEKTVSMRPAIPTSVTKARYPLGPPGPAAAIIGSASHGAILFKQDCESCHGPQGTDKIPNPGSDDGIVPPLNPVDRSLFSPDPQVFAENIDRFIQHGSIPNGKNPRFHMPAFGDTNTLTQQAISQIEAYILHFNGVDRAQLAHPGIQPLHFFWLVVLVFGLVGVGLGVVWMWAGPWLKRNV